MNEHKELESVCCCVQSISPLPWKYFQQQLTPLPCPEGSRAGCPLHAQALRCPSTSPWPIEILPAGLWAQADYTHHIVSFAQACPFQILIPLLFSELAYSETWALANILRGTSQGGPAIPCHQVPFHPGDKQEHSSTVSSHCLRWQHACWLQLTGLLSKPVPAVVQSLSASLQHPAIPGATKNSPRGNCQPRFHIFFFAAAAALPQTLGTAFNTVPNRCPLLQHIPTSSTQPSGAAAWTERSGKFAAWMSVQSSGTALAVS